MRARLLVLSCLAIAAGCGGSRGCPTMSVDAQSLAAQAAAIEFAVYDDSATCDGNDVAAGAPSPIVNRRVDGHAGTNLQLPPGRYVVVLHAFDANGAFIGSACEPELFTPGQEACLSVQLTQPMYDGDGGVIVEGGDGGGAGGTGGGGGGGGTTTGGFVTQTSGVASTLYQPWTPGGGVVYIAGAGGVVLKTTDYGATWTKLTTGTTIDLEAVWGSSATDVYAVGLQATMLHTTNGGMTWTKIATGANSSGAFYDIWGTSATDIYVSADFGTMLHGSGSTWGKVNLGGGNAPAVNCVWGASASEVYAFNVKGNVYKGSALTFNPVATPTADALLYGWGANGGADLWIPSLNSTGDSATLWHSSDHGATWKVQKNVATPIWAVWSTPAGHAYIVGAALIEESTDHGATWTPAGSTAATLYGVGGDPTSGDVWTVGINGVILHHAP